MTFKEDILEEYKRKFGLCTEIGNCDCIEELDFISKALDRQAELVIHLFKTEYGYRGKHIDRDENAKKCGCCYCSACGHHYDDCVCENNSIHKFVESLK